MKRTPLKSKAPLRRKAPIRTTGKPKGHHRAGSAFWRNKADKLITALFRNKPCLVCGTTRNTCGHHLIPRSRSALHRHTLLNLVPLCPEHHRFGMKLAAHSDNALAVQRFVELVQVVAPEHFAHWTAHEYDIGKPDYEARHEALSLIAAEAAKENA